tara:strand:+ start:1616 stop:2617 length:1002 start_codon:yes stop_codon:yes gene_type:complete
MATYKNIKGSRVRVEASDPSPVDVGDIWYNSTSDVLKYRSQGKFWTETTEVNAGRQKPGGCGESAEAAMFWSGAPAPYTVNVEIWNGSSWAETANVNAARFACSTGLGTTSAALFGGGGTGAQPQGVALSEEWNGSSWAEGTNMITARVLSAGFGTQTAGVQTGGYNSCIAYPSDLGYTEEYNGSSWSEGSDLNTVRRASGSAIISTSTAGMIFGGTGFIGGVKDETEQWNGSSWSEVGDLNTARSVPVGLGTSTAAACVGGAPGYSALTEDWTGSVWATGNVVNTARKEATSGGSGSAGLFITGNTGSPSTAGSLLMEEYAQSGVTKTVTSS